MRRSLIIKGFLILSLFCTYDCSSPKETAKENLQNEDLKKFIGKSLTLTGQTINMKLGTLLITGNGESIWMDGMNRKLKLSIKK